MSRKLMEECHRGHPFTPENTKTYFNKRQNYLQRFCLTCQREYHREYTRKKRIAKRKTLQERDENGKIVTCLRGHALTEENVYYVRRDDRVSRRCRVCLYVKKTGAPPKHPKGAHSGRGNYRVDVCQNGHEYTEENTYLYHGAKRDYRMCRVCMREATRKRRSEKGRQS